MLRDTRDRSIVIRRAKRAARVAIPAAGAVAVVAAVDHVVAFPLLFASIGPTAYQLFYDPGHEQSKVARAGTAHLVAALAGLAGLAAFGLFFAPSALTSGHVTPMRIGAVAVGLALTLAVLELLDAHHAPAGATNLLVTTGIAGPWTPFAGLLGGVALLLCAVAIIDQLPWAGRQPRDATGAPTGGEPAGDGRGGGEQAGDGRGGGRASERRGGGAGPSRRTFSGRRSARIDHSPR